jgi:phosphoribosylaminoimidazolecarboxamide formyltransferase/IMP cyclohydrolase
MNWVGVVVKPDDYANILTELTAENGLSFSTRQQLAIKAFAHTAHYDQIIYDYLAARMIEKTEEPLLFPSKLNLSLKKCTDLRYGENPHQAACAYQFTNGTSGVLSAKQYQGKQLSYNNILDADAAVACIKAFSQPACVIVKHANPCGVAVAQETDMAFQLAFQADAQSAFGGIVALNRLCDKKTAEAIRPLFIEVLIAPAYTSEALALLSSKQTMRVLEWDLSAASQDKQQEFKFIQGGMLVQDPDTAMIQSQNLEVVTQLKPTVEDIETLLFAWSVLKQVKSNAIVIANNHVTVGIGAGQVSRVDAVSIALKKAGSRTNGAVLASDAFFPFRDSIDRLAGTGIRVVIQPGGSMRDQEVIDACNEHQLAMVFTRSRCFKH